VAANIIWSGVGLVKSSILGLMDTALPPEDQQLIQQILEPYRQQGIQFHALRTRSAAARRFISLHVLVPGEWTVQQGHNLVERLEADLRSRFEPVTVFTHLEPLEDSVSWQDTSLDRQKL
jgi:divalent metal cation (Fe/Co/Zn/Cd) transporter